MIPVEESKNLRINVSAAPQDPGEFQLADEWVANTIAEVIRFIHNAKIVLGGTRVTLTAEERVFLKVLERAIANYLQMSKDEDAAFTRKIEAEAARRKEDPQLTKKEHVPDHKKPSNARFSSAKLEKALALIQTKGSVKGTILARHIDVELSTFHANYVPALKERGVENDLTGDGYYLPT